MPEKMSQKKHFLDKWKPAVSTKILVLAAGGMWLGVGLALNALAGHWLVSEPNRTLLTVVCLGLFFALLIHHFGFLRLVDKNLHRLLPTTERRCFFAFIPWKSYLLILVMASMGHMIRNSPLPKPALSAVYIAIGTALLLSSFRYFRFFVKMTSPADAPADKSSP